MPKIMYQQLYNIYIEFWNISRWAIGRWVGDGGWRREFTAPKKTPNYSTSMIIPCRLVARKHNAENARLHQIPRKQGCVDCVRAQQKY